MGLLERAGPDRHAIIVEVLAVPVEGLVRGPRLDDEIPCLAEALPRIAERRAEREVFLGHAADKAGNDPAARHAVEHRDFLRQPHGMAMQRGQIAEDADLDAPGPLRQGGRDEVRRRHEAVGLGVVLVHADGVEAELLEHRHLIEVLGVDRRGARGVEESVRIRIVRRRVEMRPGQEVEPVDLHRAAAPSVKADALAPGTDRPHRLEAVLDHVAVQLDAVAVGIGKVDAARHVVLDRGFDRHTHRLQLAMGVAQLLEAAELPRHVVQPRLLGGWRLPARQLEHRQIVVLRAEAEKHRTPREVLVRHLEAQRLDVEVPGLARVADLQHHVTELLCLDHRSLPFGRFERRRLPSRKCGSVRVRVQPAHILHRTGPDVARPPGQHLGVVTEPAAEPDNAQLLPRAVPCPVDARRGGDEHQQGARAVVQVQLRAPGPIVDDGADHASAHRDQPPFRRRPHVAGRDLERRGSAPLSRDLKRGRLDRDALVARGERARDADPGPELDRLVQGTRHVDAATGVLQREAVIECPRRDGDHPVDHHLRADRLRAGGRDGRRGAPITVGDGAPDDSDGDDQAHRAPRPGRSARTCGEATRGKAAHRTAILLRSWPRCQRACRRCGIAAPSPVAESIERELDGSIRHFALALRAVRSLRGALPSRSSWTT